MVENDWDNDRTQGLAICRRLETYLKNCLQPLDLDLDIRCTLESRDNPCPRCEISVPRGSLDDVLKILALELSLLSETTDGEESEVTFEAVIPAIVKSANWSGDQVFLLNIHQSESLPKRIEEELPATVKFTADPNYGQSATKITHLLTNPLCRALVIRSNRVINNWGSSWTIFLWSIPILGPVRIVFTKQFLSDSQHRERCCCASAVRMICGSGGRRDQSTRLRFRWKVVVNADALGADDFCRWRKAGVTAPQPFVFALLTDQSGRMTLYSSVISKIASISTAIPPGSELVPKALLAATPASCDVPWIG